MDKKTVKVLGSLLDKKFDQNLEPIHSKLDALSLDMIDVQIKADVIADIHDMLKNTKEKVDDHEQRIEVLEHAA